MHIAEIADHQRNASDHEETMATNLLSTRFATDEERWQAVQTRDPAADGAFVYAVTTTGIFCRPICPARRALRANVQFFHNAVDAQRAGFRACKRCRPATDSPLKHQAEIVTVACRAIESAATPPTLKELASAARLSPYHFHRMFKAQTGVTPKAYAAAHRVKRVRQELTARETVTDAIYSAGFGASSRFYATASATLGMTPQAFRSGGAGETIRYAIGECWLGAILVAASERGLCAILLGDEPDDLVSELQERFSQAKLVAGDREFETWMAQVIGFVDRPSQGLHLPLDVRGTAFQRQVWEVLRAIPAGETVTYTELAQRVGRPEAVRAVASACAANALAVAIPCHRVVRTDGSLSGYRWGVARKRDLIAHERNAVKKQPPPRCPMPRLARHQIDDTPPRLCRTQDRFQNRNTL
jgi:AraC family transcriptional regulator of adaptative response/methylated-DNA-[protein]-cysteine methyltransferase